MNSCSPFADNSARSDGIPACWVCAGCFWCVEAVYQRVVGVESVESGYMGGVVKNPSYGQVKGNSLLPLYKACTAVALRRVPRCLGYVFLALFPFSCSRIAEL